MKMRFLILLAVAGSVQPLADVIPGRWEKVDALPQGEEIIVALRSGEKREGAFQSSSGSDLTLVLSDRTELKIAKAEVLTVTSQERIKDPLTNGLWVGALVGLGTAAAIAASEELETHPVGYPVSAGIGAFIGALIDEAHKKRESLYKAP